MKQRPQVLGHIYTLTYIYPTNTSIRQMGIDKNKKSSNGYSEMSSKKGGRLAA